MSDHTGIQWTSATWNPVTGCSKVSQGCKNCYALRDWPRLSKNPRSPYYGRAFTDVQCHPERLDQPLRWKRPRRVFVNSMSDLFHEDVPFEFIDQVFAVMALAHQHVFQVLTKRPERLREYLASRFRPGRIADAMVGLQPDRKGRIGRTRYGDDWPLPNVHLGVSIEDQATADERIPLLLDTPAAVRWVSAEPLLGAVDFRNVARQHGYASDVLAGHRHDFGVPMENLPSRIDWIVVGGESGPKARPCDVEWIRSVVRQCQAVGVPAFVKQLGASVLDRNDRGFEAEIETDVETGEPADSEAWPTPYDIDLCPHGHDERYQGADCRVVLRDRKGGDPSEWPADLRVREWPLVDGEHGLGGAA